MRKIEVLVSILFLILGSKTLLAKTQHQKNMNPALEDRKATAKKAISEMSVLDGVSTTETGTTPVTTTNTMVIPAGSLAEQAKAAEKAATKATTRATALDKGTVASTAQSKFKDSREGAPTGTQIDSQAAALQKISQIDNGAPRGRLNGNTLSVNGNTAQVTIPSTADAVTDITKAKALKVGDPVTMLQGLGNISPTDPRLVAVDLNPAQNLKSWFGNTKNYWVTDGDTQDRLNRGGDAPISRMIGMRMPDGSIMWLAGGAAAKPDPK